VDRIGFGLAASARVYVRRSVARRCACSAACDSSVSSHRHCRRRSFRLPARALLPPRPRPLPAACVVVLEVARVWALVPERDAVSVHSGLINLTHSNGHPNGDTASSPLCITDLVSQQEGACERVCLFLDAGFPLTRPTFSHV